MRLSVSIPVGVKGGPLELARMTQDYERGGADAVWLGEGYGFDVPTTLGYLAAVTERIQLGSGILNAYSRTPAALAQTAAGIDWLSGGRSMLGLGTSGPQVIEGFHGIPFESPVQRITEIIEICRKVWRREPLVHDGKVFTLPLPADEGTGVGKPIKLMHHPVRLDIPIWWGSLGPHAVEATAELANGWLTFLLIPEKLRDVWGESLDRGLAKRDDALGPLRIQAGVKVAIGEHVDATRSAIRSAPCWRSTWAGWERVARTSTTISPWRTDSSRKLPRSRTDILPVGVPRPPTWCRRRGLTRCAWSARRGRSVSSSQHSARPA